MLISFKTQYNFHVAKLLSLSFHERDERTNMTDEAYMKLAIERELEKLKCATEEQLRRYDEKSCRKRLAWFHSERCSSRHFACADTKEAAYRLLLERLNTTEEQAPIVLRDDRKLVFHSQNFCPTLEACKILGLETRIVCKFYNEHSTDMLVKQIDSKLRFARNYTKLRPYSAYCEEMILLES